MKYHLFQSEKHSNSAITVGERRDGSYFLPAAIDKVPPEENRFDSIEQIELILNDSLTLIVPNKEEK